ncbi:hypothetical protein FEJ68_002106, partial [Neisseria gonorrhoeae]
AGGGRAVCRYDTEVPIYKGGLQPAKSTNSAESTDSRRRHSRISGNPDLSARKPASRHSHKSGNPERKISRNRFPDKFPH